MQTGSEFRAVAPGSGASRFRLALVALTAFFGLELVIRVLPRLDTAPLPLALLREAGVLAFALALAAFVVRQRWFDRRTLGFVAPRPSTIGWGLVAALVMVVLSVGMIAVMQVFKLEQSSAMLSALASRPVWMVVIISAVAAVSEEIVFRSVLITHLAALGGSTLVGAIGSIALFGLAHLSGWGPIHVVFAAFGGIVPTIAFLWKRDIGICMIAHFITDCTGLLAAAAQAHAHP